MKISYRWLNQYVDHEWAPGELAEALTMAGLEVDAVEEIGQFLDGVVVGEIRSVRAHPNADRLVLCDVDLGNGEPVQIACGAPNVAEGQKAAVAPVGTTLALPDPDDPDVRKQVDIEARSIRGEASHGMICAEDELGLSDDHSGIMVLDDDASVGQPLIEYLREHDVTPDDAVLDIELTPNRPDAASHMGVARDVAALAGSELNRPDVPLPAAGGEVAAEVNVHLEDDTGCPRYVAMLVRDIDVRESPLWLRRRLSAIGLQPRNHVVDVTNFVLHESGQPLHAFDRAALAGDTITVRRTDGETSFTTLDDQERTLPPNTLLICDDERPVAVAGVMGGANSEVGPETTDVLIESAYFDPSTIRKTAKALDVQTDSSYRFERGVDREGQVWAAARAAHLIAELGGGTVVPGMVDEHPEPPTRRSVTLRPDRLRGVLGLDVATEEMTRLLDAIGFEPDAGAEGIRCTVPTWRPDVTIEEDLIEEVARLHGYDQIPEPDHVPVPGGVPSQRPEERLERQVRSFLDGRGYREIYTNSMLPIDRAERFNRPPAGSPQGAIVETKNPISEQMAALRPRLLPGALEVMQHNRNHGQEALRMFEFGRVYRRASADEEPLVPGYAEHSALLIGVSGPHAPVGWDSDPRTSDVFDLKGIVEALVDDLRIPDVEMTPRAPEEAEQGAITTHHVDVASNGTALGSLSRVRDEVAAAFDVETPIFVAEFNWEAIVEHATAGLHRTYEPVSRFPVVDRDVAVIVHSDQPVGPMQDTIRQTGGDLLRRVDVFDVYEGEGIEEHEKSVAFTLRFGADRTLTDEEVDEEIAMIVEALDREHNAHLRQ